MGKSFRTLTFALLFALPLLVAPAALAGPADGPKQLEGAKASVVFNSHIVNWYEERGTVKWVSDAGVLFEATEAWDGRSAFKAYDKPATKFYPWQILLKLNLL